MDKLEVSKPGDREFRSILAYGPTGAGKSWFGASAESSLGGRTLIVSTEGADSGLQGFDVDIVDIGNSPGKTVGDELRDILRFLKNGKHDYKVGVVDSLSQLQKFGLAGDSEAQFKAGNTKTPLNIPLDSYKRVGEDIRRMLWFAKVVPMHWVYICLDRVFVSEDNTVRMVGPNLTESLSGDVRAYCDVVGYMVADMADVQKKDGSMERKLVRRMWLQPGEGFHARVRAGKGIEVPPFVVNPTVPKIINLLGGGK